MTIPMKPELREVFRHLTVLAIVSMVALPSGAHAWGDDEPLDEIIVYGQPTGDSMMNRLISDMYEAAWMNELMGALNAAVEAVAAVDWEQANSTYCAAVKGRIRNECLAHTQSTYNQCSVLSVGAAALFFETGWGALVIGAGLQLGCDNLRYTMNNQCNSGLWPTNIGANPGPFQVKGC